MTTESEARRRGSAGERRPATAGVRAALLCGLILALAGCASAGAGGGEASEGRPYWRWSMDRIRSEVAPARAGKNLQPDSWPEGARVAVLLSFDVDNETLWLNDPGGPTLGGLSRGEFGSRRGLRRVLDLLDRHRIPATFFLPAVSLRLAPEQAELIGSSGRHEFGVHGWIHEDVSRLDSATERSLIRRARATLEEITGTTPVGYRAPSWYVSRATPGILQDMGFLYDSSLMADDRPYELVSYGEPTGIVELPVSWIRDDASIFDPLGDNYASPREILQVWKDEFDVAYEEGTVFLLTMHPHIIGQRSRIVVLRELIEHMRSREGVWFATHREAAEYVKQRRLEGR